MARNYLTCSPPPVQYDLGPIRFHTAPFPHIGPKSHIQPEAGREQSLLAGATPVTADRSVYHGRRGAVVRGEEGAAAVGRYGRRCVAAGSSSWSPLFGRAVGRAGARRAGRAHGVVPMNESTTKARDAASRLPRRAGRNTHFCTASPAAPSKADAEVSTRVCVTAPSSEMSASSTTIPPPTALGG